MSEDALFSAGDLLRDRYRIIRRVGKGGGGEVYEVWDLHDQRRVALKTVVRERVDSVKALGRFRLEMELLQRISHPNVLRIFELFQVPVEVPEDPWRRPFGTRDVSDAPPSPTAGEGSIGSRQIEVPCMIMEHLEGETLADRLERGETWTPEEAKPLICQMASGLAAAHAEGVVHRDLKPDNVFLASGEEDPSGQIPGGQTPRVVLTDFGVARRAVVDDPNDTHTASDVILGTPSYMAPEQLELEKAMPASDIYTLGLVMFEMLTGRQPFQAETAIKTVFKRVQEDPPSPREFLPDLDPRWEETILRCLARRPEDRFDDPLEIVRGLDGGGSEWLAEERWQRRRRLVLIAAAALALAAVAAVVLTLV